MINFKSDTTSLSTLLRDESKLFFHFSEFNCKSCVDQELINLNEIIPKDRVDDVIILSTYNNTRRLKLFLRNYNIDFQTYLIPLSEKYFFSKTQLPFYFVINSKGTIINSFVPDKSNNEMTNYFIEQYLK